MTVTHSQHDNGSHCLALTDDGSAGWPHSGPALFDGTLSGVFQIIGGLIMVSIDDGGVSQNAGSVYSATASNGNLGKGAITEIYDGESIDSGKLVFGARGGC